MSVTEVYDIRSGLREGSSMWETKSLACSARGSERIAPRRQRDQADCLPYSSSRRSQISLMVGYAGTACQRRAIGTSPTTATVAA